MAASITPRRLLSATAIVIIITTTPTLFFSATAAAAPFKKIYAFGDSFTDTGNTRSAGPGGGYGHVSNPPYGSTYFHRPTNRYSDGRLVIDFVAQSLSLPFLPPYRSLAGKDRRGGAKNGVNFAVGGATAIKHAFFAKNNLTLDNTPESIETQLGWFDEFLASQGCNGTPSAAACSAAVEDALFWVGEIGVNDYAYILGSEISRETIQKLSIATVTNFLEALLKRGAKKMVVQGLPPAGCLTLAMYLSPDDDRDDLGCVKSVNRQANVHNSVYKTKLQILRARHPEASIVYLNYWSAYRSVVRNPRKYRMKETFTACCGSGDPPYNFNIFATCGAPGAAAVVCRDPARYINWDGVHLTEGMYRVLADMFVNGSFSSPRFATLLA